MSEVWKTMKEWAHSTLILVTFLALSAWTWRKWADPLTDFGREVYVPWQLVGGKVLYRDIAYLNGPLSPYLNAAWFRIFGVSLTTIALCNLTVLLITTALIYAIFKTACDRLTASVGSLVFLCVFAFSQYIFVSNYNFVTPYSHELTHGTCLSLAMIFLLCRPARWHWIYIILPAGLLLGLVFLTKAEVFLAAAAAAVVGLALLLPAERFLHHRTGTDLLAFGAGLLLPIVLFFVFLYTRMPGWAAIEGIGGSWSVILGSEVIESPFYQRGMGLDNFGANSMTMMRTFASLVLIGAGIALADIGWKKKGYAKILFFSAGVLSFMSGVSLKDALMPWLLTARSLPLVAAVTALLIVIHCVRQWKEKSALVMFAPVAMWNAFSLVLLGKIILNTRFHHYGFALAMPATLLLVAWFLWLIPNALQKTYGTGSFFRSIAVAMILADMTFFLSVSQRFYRQKNFYLGPGSDALVTYEPAYHPIGMATALALEFIDATSVDSTLVVIPDGAMLNYLSRRSNPTPFVTYMPVELSLFQERRIIRALSESAPDYIVLVHNEPGDYGVTYFGIDPKYGKQIMDWIGNHYVTVRLIIAEPLKDENFGIKIMKRRT